VIPPERTDARIAQLRKRARRALERGGIQVGGDHLINPIVDAMILECERIRETCGKIIEAFDDRGDRLMMASNPAYDGGLKDLQYMIENHYLDDHGSIRIEVVD
jgi:hypothetical protein